MTKSTTHRPHEARRTSTPVRASSRRAKRVVLASCAALALSLVGTHARAEGPVVDRPVVIWPTMTPAGDEASPQPVHRPTEVEQTVFARAQELDATLRDAAQDLGFTLHVGDTGPTPGQTRDTDLLARAKRSDASGAAEGTWVVSPRLEYAGGDTFLVRMVAVPPLGRELRVRVETVKGPDVAVRGLVMLRDLLSAKRGEQSVASEHERGKVDTGANLGVMSPLRSPGRAVLAINGALFGAYVAYSVQRASGNDDPRVLYPLLALGTGVGIGSSLLAAEEWDVGTGEAWFLSAGAWWGAASGVLIANGRHVQPLTDRYAWGIGAGLGGLGLGVFALTRSKVDEGDAALAHSGGAFGMALGGLGELFYRGIAITDAPTPYTGGGYGAGIGLLAAGTLASFVRVSPSRVMLVDLGAGLGGLAGAALASPLIFENVNPGKTRGFLGVAAGGTLAGGVAAFWLTRHYDDKPPIAALRYGTPYAGVVGSSATKAGSEPAYGVGVQGKF